MSNFPKSSVLVVDDELSIRESFSLILEERYNVLLAASGESALKKLVDEKVDLAYLDIRMPGMDGMEALKRMMEIDNDLTVVMITAVNDVQKASEAIKLGAKDYIVKPFNVDDIQRMTEKILKKNELKKEAKEVRSAGEPLKGLEIIGKSKAIIHIIELIERSAEDDSSVLIYGKAGVESKAVATTIHRESKRASKSFKTLNIMGKAENLLKAALFGSGKGTSSETLKKEKGILEESNEGTLFLENIDKLPLSIQKEFAGSIKNKEIKRIGSATPIPINVRIISTTSVDLKELTRQNSFSKELFDLLSETIIEIPPLSDRSGDIPMLLDYYREYFAGIYNKTISGFSEDALEVLTSYSFPGNTEELKNLVKQMVLKSEGDEITLKDAPLDIMIKSAAFTETEESKNLTFEEIYSDLEKSFIKKILEKTNNDIEKTSKICGLNLSAFQAKLESLGIKTST